MRGLTELNKQELSEIEGGYWFFDIVVDAILISAGHHETMEEYGLTN